MIPQKRIRRLRRKLRIRAKLQGSLTCPRVSVFRSNRGLYAQLIDDKSGKTLVGLSDRSLEGAEKNKIVRAKLLGKQIAELAQKVGVKRVVFDRSGYAYHGRVKALSEGLHEGGLKF